MNEELREALEAVSAGQPGRARVILAEYLREDPQNIPAWVLLSKLATTESQKSAFLRKIIELDPDHVYARQALAELGGPVPPVVAVEESSDLEMVSEEGDMHGTDAKEPLRAAQTEEEVFAAETSLEDDFDHESLELFDLDDEASVAVGDEAQSPEELEDDFPSFDMFATEDEDEEVADWLASESSIVSDEEHDSDWLDLDDLGAFQEEETGEREEEDVWAEFEDVENVDAFGEDLTATNDEVPSWVDTEENDDTLFEAPPPQAAAEIADEEDDLPAWLRGDDDDWLADEDEDEEFAIARSATADAAVAADAPASEKAARISAAMSQAALQTDDTDDEPSSGRGWLLGLLIVVAVVVFLLLVYAVLTFML